MRLDRHPSIALACGFFCLALGQAASAIVTNGTPDSAVTTQWSGVGIISNGLGSASGVLIDSTHILAAAHEVVNPATHLAFPANQITFQLSFGGTAFTASSIAVAPGYVGGNPTTVGSTIDYRTSDVADLAVITLSSPITNASTWGYNTVSIADETVAGNATFVGFGYGGTGAGGENSSLYPFGIKRQANNSIDLVTTTLTGTNVTNTANSTTIKLPPGVIAWDFDSSSGTPPSNGTPFGGPAVGPTEGDIANGDSGAPIFQFDPASGKYLVVGIGLDGTNNTSFGEISWGTRTAAYANFINSSVPEPTSMAAAVLGGMTLLARRRRRIG